MSATDPRRSPGASDLWWFGVIVAAFFGLLGGVVLWAGGAVAVARGLWGAGLGLAVLYYAVPPLRLPFYRGWMAAVRPIGWTVTHLVLAAIFYGLITPMGVLMRGFGRDRLRLRGDRPAESYWTEHDPADDTARYFRQT